MKINLMNSKKRFSYVAIIAGFKILNEIEENEKAFADCEFIVNSDSESDNDDPVNSNRKIYPKVCGRQNNIMPNGRLSETLEDINCDLMKRVDSNASNYQPSPKSTHCLLSISNSRLSSEDFNNRSRSSS